MAINPDEQFFLLVPRQGKGVAIWGAKSPDRVRDTRYADYWAPVADKVERLDIIEAIVDCDSNKPSLHRLLVLNVDDAGVHVIEA